MQKVCSTFSLFAVMSAAAFPVAAEYVDELIKATFVLCC